jgi:zinc protease
MARILSGIRARSAGAAVALFCLGPFGLSAEARADANDERVVHANDMERRMRSIPRPSQFRLPNGLTVVLEESHLQPQVALLVAYDIGWRDDPVGYASLAHLVEHMTYRGSRHLGPLLGLDWLERLGATAQNGLTRPDFTAYYVLLPARALSQALWIESERMAFTLERFDRDHLELERSIVRNEHRMRDGPSELLGRSVEYAIFGASHPYARPDVLAGDLDAIELSHVQWFFQQAYRPSNARLILVGDFETLRARELVERYFAPIRNPPGEVLRRGASARPFAKDRRVTVEAGVFVERLSVFWPATLGTPSADAAATLFARIMRNRLRGELVDRAAFGSDVWLRYEERDLGSRFEFSVTLRPHVDQAELMRALARVFAAGARDISDDELVLAKRSATLDEFLGLEDLVGRAFGHLSALRRTGRPFAVPERVAALRAVSALELRRLAGSYAVSPKVVARIERAGKGKNLPAAGLVEVEE